MKYDILQFVSDILSNDKLTSVDKQKIIELAKKDVTHFTLNAESLSEKVEKVEGKIVVIEEKIGIKRKSKDLLTEIKKPNEPSIDNKKVLYYTNIKNTPKFLQTLNKNTFTKFLTHDIDSNDYEELQLQFEGNYDYLKHLEKIKEVFSVLTDKNSEFINNFPDLERFSISQNLYKKINNYINNAEGWGEEEYKMNWSHPDLLSWCKENKGKTPAPGNDLDYDGFKFGDKTFKDIVLDFKNEIHIRRSNSLDFILQKVLFEPKYDLRNKILVEKKINEAIDFFTDVEKLKQIIRLIFNLIIEKHDQEGKPKVDLIFKINNKNVELLILHNDSVYGQEIATLRFGKSLINLMKLCNGISDLEILAKFSDSKSYSFPIWRGNRKIENDIVYDKSERVIPSASIRATETPINGVLYKLTFDTGL